MREGLLGQFLLAKKQTDWAEGKGMKAMEAGEVGKTVDGTRAPGEG